MATKDATVADLQKNFEESTAVLLTEYRGLTVAELRELRNSIREHATYAVAKNTLAAIAAKEADMEGLDELFTGPTAIAFVNGEVPDAAKALRDFAKANPLLVIKGGYMDGRAMSAEEVSKLADLESRDVLLGKAAGVLKAAMFQAAYVLNAPLSKAVRTVDALREKQAADS